MVWAWMGRLCVNKQWRFVCQKTNVSWTSVVKHNIPNHQKQRLSSKVHVSHVLVAFSSFDRPINFSQSSQSLICKLEKTPQSRPSTCQILDRSRQRKCMGRGTVKMATICCKITSLPNTFARGSKPPGRTQFNYKSLNSCSNPCSSSLSSTCFNYVMGKRMQKGKNHLTKRPLTKAQTKQNIKRLPESDTVQYSNSSLCEGNGPQQLNPKPSQQTCTVAVRLSPSPAKPWSASELESPPLWPLGFRIVEFDFIFSEELDDLVFPQKVLVLLFLFLLLLLLPLLLLVVVLFLLLLLVLLLVFFLLVLFVLLVLLLLLLFVVVVVIVFSSCSSCSSSVWSSCSCSCSSSCCSCCCCC